jgi:hypothetical protein
MTIKEHDPAIMHDDPWLASQDTYNAADRLYFGHIHTEYVNSSSRRRMEAEADYLGSPSIHRRYVDIVEAGLVSSTEMSVEAVQNLEENQVASMGKVVDSFQPPEFLLHSFGAQTGTELVQSVLKTPVNNDTQPQISNYFEWATQASMKRRSDFENNEAPQLLDSFGNYLKQGIQEGIIPISAAVKFDDMKQSGKFHMEETLTISLKPNQVDGRTIHATAAKYTDGSAAIRFNLAHTDDRHHTMVHEGLHAITGIDQVKDADENEDGRVSLKNYGLHRIFGDGKLGLALTEAATEHTADSLVNGNIEVVDPFDSNRQHSSGMYVAERYLLDTLCTGGLRTVDPRLFVRAMLEDETDKRGSDTRKLSVELERAFPGTNVLERIKAFGESANDSSSEGDVAIMRFANELSIEAIMTPRRIGRRILAKFMRSSL